MPEDPEVVSTGAAARAVGIGRATLWRWIKVGLITPHTRTAGGHLRWHVGRLRDEVGAIRDVLPPGRELTLPDFDALDDAELLALGAACTHARHALFEITTRLTARGYTAADVAARWQVSEAAVMRWTRPPS